MTELPMMTSVFGVIVVLLGPPQVPGGGGSDERPLNSRAMRRRSADLVSAAFITAMRSRGIPCSTRTSMSHRCTAVGSQKMRWPQCGLAATRRAHSTSFGLEYSGRGSVTLTISTSPSLL